MAKRETLGQKQRRFAKSMAKLILKAYALGYEVSLGDAFRDPRVFGKYGESKRTYGSMHSMHKLRLAQDLNLFKNGRYLTSTEAHRPLGELWMSMGPDHSWGGFGGRGDGNHYSISHYGRW